jgi:hypothetical protein
MIQGRVGNKSTGVVQFSASERHHPTETLEMSSASRLVERPRGPSGACDITGARLAMLAYQRAR